MRKSGQRCSMGLQLAVIESSRSPFVPTYFAVHDPTSSDHAESAERSEKDYTKDQASTPTVL